MHGKVKNIIKDKPFGFITGDNGKDYFFHKSSLVRYAGSMFEDLKRGDRVKFDDEEGEKELRAENVTLA